MCVKCVAVEKEMKAIKKARLVGAINLIATEPLTYFWLSVVVGVVALALTAK